MLLPPGIFIESLPANKTPRAGGCKVSSVCRALSCRQPELMLVESTVSSRQTQSLRIRWILYSSHIDNSEISRMSDREQVLESHQGLPGPLRQMVVEFLTMTSQVHLGREKVVESLTRASKVHSGREKVRKSQVGIRGLSQSSKLCHWYRQDPWKSTLN